VSASIVDAEDRVRKNKRCKCGAWTCWTPSTAIEAAGWLCDECGEFVEDKTDWRYGLEPCGEDGPSDADPGL